MIEVKQLQSGRLLCATKITQPLIASEYYRPCRRIGLFRDLNELMSEDAIYWLTLLTAVLIVNACLAGYTQFVIKPVLHKFA